MISGGKQTTAASRASCLALGPCLPLYKAKNFSRKNFWMVSLIPFSVLTTFNLVFAPIDFDSVKYDASVS